MKKSYFDFSRLLIFIFTVYGFFSGTCRKSLKTIKQENNKQTTDTDWRTYIYAKGDVSTIR